MITQWDIISRMDPKTKIVRYTLVTDGTEADARIILKKLKGQVSALKKALRPFIYAFRLHNDLDENTLENIRTAVREVIEQTDKLNKSAVGRASNDLFGDDSTIRIAPEKPSAQNKAPFADSQSIELDLEDATIISSKRIVGKDENPQPPSAQSVSAKRYEENVKNPTLPVIDMMTPAPKLDAQAGNDSSMPVLPEDTFVARGKTGNKQDLVALDAPRTDLPDIDPSKDKKSSKLSGWFHHKKQEPAQQSPAKKEEKTVQRPPVKARPEPKPESVLKPIGEPPVEKDDIPRLDSPGSAENDPLLMPLEARGKDAAQPSPAQPVAQPQPAPQTQEPLPIAQESATEPVTQPQAEKTARTEQAQPAPAEQPAPSKADEKPAQETHTFSLIRKRKVASPTPAKTVEPADDFPQINVQVRPAVFDEEETKTQSVAQAQPNKTAQNLPAPQEQAEPVQAQPAPQKQAELAAQVKAEPVPVQPEEKQPQAQTQAEPKEQAEPALQAQPAPEVKAEPAPQTQPAESQAQETLSRKEEDVTEEEQMSLHPLNISLEDMFLAETKYDMFVDIDETLTRRATASGTQQAQPEPKAKEPQAEKTEQKAKEPKAETSPKAQPKAEKQAQEPATKKPAAQNPAKKVASKPAPVKKVPPPPPPPPQPRRLIKRRTPKDTL